MISYVAIGVIALIIFVVKTVQDYEGLNDKGQMWVEIIIEGSIVFFAWPIVLLGLAIHKLTKHL